MEIFLKVLQSSYAYLLIFQILVVSLLFLLLLTLVVSRIREAATLPGTPELHVQATTQPRVVANAPNAPADQRSIEPQATTSASPVPPPPPTAAATGTTPSEAPTAGSTTTEDSKNLEPLKTQNATLTEQVKFLESKLLEYEILQEEIGTLSTLKMENEQLKQKMVSLESKVSKAPKTGSPPVEPTVLQSSTPAAIPKAEIETEKPKEPIPVAPTKIEAPPEAIAQVVEAKSEAASDLAGLESLLQQIDSLTKSDSPPHA